MRNHKQMLADFYLYLLTVEYPNAATLDLRRALNAALAYELCTEQDVIQCIFERMASEDLNVTNK